jgi:hypothetical protein
MGIEQLPTGQIHGHGVDAEVAPGQIVCEAAERDPWIVRRHWVSLGPGGSHVEKHRLPSDHELQLNGAKSTMLPGGTRG